jgi:hypothetical protein
MGITDNDVIFVGTDIFWGLYIWILLDWRRTSMIRSYKERNLYMS